MLSAELLKAGLELWSSDSDVDVRNRAILYVYATLENQRETHDLKWHEINFDRRVIWRYQKGREYSLSEDAFVALRAWKLRIETLAESLGCSLPTEVFVYASHGKIYTWGKRFRWLSNYELPHLIEEIREALSRSASENVEAWRNDMIAADPELQTLQNKIVALRAELTRLEEQLEEKLNAPDGGEFDTTIRELDLSVRAFNALQRAGYKSVGDILQTLNTMPLSDAGIRNFGRLSEIEVMGALRTRGYIP